MEKPLTGPKNQNRPQPAQGKPQAREKRPFREYLNHKRANGIPLTSRERAIEIAAFHGETPIELD